MHSFDEARFLDESLRPLMAKISVRADEEMTKQFPESVPVRVEATSRSGSIHRIELSNRVATTTIR